MNVSCSIVDGSCCSTPSATPLITESAPPLPEVSLAGGPCTSGFKSAIVISSNFWQIRRLAEGVDVRKGESLVCAASQCILDSRAGLHVLGLNFFEKRFFSKDIAKYVG